MTDNINDWITAREAREISSYSEAGLRNLVKHNKLQIRKMGRYTLYYRPEIEALPPPKRGKRARKRD